MASSITPKHYPFDGIPAGYDANLARQLSTGVAEEIRRACGGEVSAQNGNCYGYNRSIVERFQRAAGSDADGLYGPYTVSALEYYGVEDPPRHLFRMGDEIPPYRPPEDDAGAVATGGGGGGGGGEVIIDVPADGGAPVVQEAGMGGGLWGAVFSLGTAVSLAAASIRGSAPGVPFAGHRSRRKRSR